MDVLRLSCSHCGATHRAAALFCSGCGQDLSGEPFKPSFSALKHTSSAARSRHRPRAAWAMLALLAASVGGIALADDVRARLAGQELVVSPPAVVASPEPSLPTLTPPTPPPAAVPTRPAVEPAPTKEANSSPRSAPKEPDSPPVVEVPEEKKEPAEPKEPKDPKDPPAPLVPCSELLAGVSGLAAEEEHREQLAALLADRQREALSDGGERLAQFEQEATRLEGQRTAAAGALRAFLAAHPSLRLPAPLWSELLTLRARYQQRVVAERTHLRTYRDYLARYADTAGGWHRELEGRLARQGERERGFLATVSRDAGARTAECAGARLERDDPFADLSAAADFVVARVARRQESVQEALDENRRVASLATTLSAARSLLPAEATYQRVEELVQELTARFGSPAAAVHCVAVQDDWDRLVAEEIGDKEVAGFVSYEQMPGTVYLSPGICGPIRNWLNNRAQKLGCVAESLRVGREVCYGAESSLVYAVDAVTHEAIHVTGVTDEAVTQCLSAARDGETATLLGMQMIAPYIGDYIRRFVTPRMGLEYRGGTC